MLSQAYFGILSPASLKRSAQAQCDDPIGSGAFEVKQWIHGQELILVRNPDYTSWPATALHKGPAIVNEVDWKFLSDPVERYAALTTGEANAMYDIPTVDWTSAKASYQVTQYITPGKPVSLYLNTINGVFTDAQVRQAFAYGADRKAAVQTAFHGVIPYEGNPSVSQATPGYDAAVASAYPYEPAKANQLLNQAGWTGRDAAGYRTKDGKELDVKLAYPAGSVITDEGATLLQILQQQWKQIGFNVTLIPETQAETFSGAYSTPTSYDAQPWYWTSPSPAILWIVWRPSTKSDPNYSNSSFYNNAQLGDVIADGNTAATTPRRTSTTSRRSRSSRTRPQRSASTTRRCRSRSRRTCTTSGSRRARASRSSRTPTSPSEVSVEHSRRGHGPRGLPAAVRAPNARTARRILVKVVTAILVLVAAASVTFFAQLLVPGSRATAILNQQNGRAQQWTAAQLAPVNHEFGFDKPLIVQYLDYVGGLFHGNLGTSYTQFKPVTQVIGDELVPSLVLTVGGLAAAWVLALGVILLTAKRRRFISALGSTWEALTASLPTYWVGVVLLVVFAVEIRIFPVIGGTSAWGTVLPVLTLAIPLAGFLGQVMRDEFERVLDQPFITTARTRGMGDTRGPPRARAAALGPARDHAVRLGARRARVRRGHRGEPVRPAGHRPGPGDRGEHQGRPDGVGRSSWWSRPCT